MNKWINVESVINKFSMYVGFTTRPDMMRAIQIIKDEPGIDIVRCKECKYASDNHVYGCMCNHFNGNDWDYHRMYADDFCSRGERKECE